MKTFYQLYIQFIFSVKKRQKLILPEYKEEMNKYISGIVKNRGHKVLAINGTRDHIHILVSMSRDLNLSDLMEDVKSASSNFINKKRFLRQKFEWQVGYGAFTCSHQELYGKIKYIKNQELHHKDLSFEEEFKRFLDEYGIEYNPKYLFND